MPGTRGVALPIRQHDPSWYGAWAVWPRPPMSRDRPTDLCGLRPRGTRGRLARRGTAHPPHAPARAQPRDPAADGLLFPRGFGELDERVVERDRGQVVARQLGCHGAPCALRRHDANVSGVARDVLAPENRHKPHELWRHKGVCEAAPVKPTPSQEDKARHREGDPPTSRLRPRASAKARRGNEERPAGRHPLPLAHACRDRARHVNTGKAEGDLRAPTLR